MSKALPDGISQSQVTGKGGALSLRLRWYPLFVLGAVVALAMFGVFGGLGSPVIEVEGDAGTLQVEAPAILRNGEFFEMHITGIAHEALAKPTIAVESRYWNDLTINTMLPAPASEGFKEGFFLFEFDPFEPGERIELKIDGQVNPSMFAGTEGAIEWRDGDRVLARTPIELRVMP